MKGKQDLSWLSLMKVYLDVRPIYFFIFLSIVFLAFTFLIQNILVNEDLYYKSFKDTLTFDRIDFLFWESKRLLWITYALVPLIILIRSMFTSLCINLGAYLSDLKLTFAQCFNISIKAEIVFLIAIITKMYYYIFFGANSLEEMNSSPFSVLWIIKAKIEPWLLYPLGILNLFELFYWLLLALLLTIYTRKSFGTSLSFVAKTYGIGLILWVSFIMFISISLT